MAKIRVYELAKKLNLTNKALLTKLKAMNIEVKSHMSSLEDEAVRQVRESMFGKKTRQFDVRVRSSVIRRRKKDKVEQTVEEAPSEEALTEEAATEQPSAPPTEADAPDSIDKSPVEVTDYESEPEAAAVEEKTVEPEEKTVDKAPEKKDEGQAAPKPAAERRVITRKAEPAKIIRPSVSPKPAAEEKEKDKEPVIPAAEDANVPEKEAEPEPEIESTAPKPSEEPEIETMTEEGSEPVKAQEKPEVEETDVQVVAAEESEEETAAAGKDKKKRKKKQAKKSEPAKIIRVLPPSMVRPPAGSESSQGAPGNRDASQDGPASGQPYRKVGAKAGDEAGAGPQPGSDDRPKRKKDKKRKGDQFESDEDIARRIGRKRKAVVEGKDLYERGARGGKRGRKKDSRSKKANIQKTQITVPKAIKRRIKIDETIELSELAKRMGIKANEMIVKLMGMGVMATVNQTIDFDTASLVAAEFEYEVEKASFEEDVLINTIGEEDDPDKLIERPPVVTIMGHVDHGKTSLLDVIRKSKITTGEAGGITQHIGAYSVMTPSGQQITFLDTPGHAAFTSMRSRGAQVTDLVVLVVAADDGVMPQTIEAINHSKAADVPVVVAINKMDKPGADPDRVMRELSEHGLLSEEWGGDTIFARVSAKAETGIDDLLEMILLQAEVLELKSNPDRLATGHVVEARLDAGRGPVATILVEQGTLRAGQPVVCGLHAGKIRVMIGDTGDTVDEAGPSTPVEIVGLSGVPEAGDEFVALQSEKDAKQISDHRMQKQRAKELAKRSRANLEKLFENMGAGEIKELKLIVKADVHGSIEALNESIMKLAQEEVDIRIVHSGTGAINESDVSLAAVSDAIIIGFNVRPTPKVRAMAKEENVDMRFYDIIYNVINDIKAAITGLMPSTFHEVVLGRAEVRETFVIPNKGTIAGCFVQEGKLTRGDKIRLLRDGVIKCDSSLASLRRFKDDVKEVVQGYECGIGLEKFNDIKVGDVFECYEMEERKAQME